MKKLDYPYKAESGIEILWRVTKSKKCHAICHCGKAFAPFFWDVLGGKTRSCGCLCKEINSKLHYKHGGNRTSEYFTWATLKQRLTNVNHKEFNYFFKHKIELDPAWVEFKNFISDMGLKPSSKHKLLRVDKFKGFNKDNCYWGLK